MMTLKRLAVISSCAGAGFALTSAVLIFAYRSYSQHQHNVWNGGAVTARFTRFDLSEAQNGKPASLTFTYTFENHGENDYSFSKDDSFKMFAKSQSGDLMETGWEGPTVPIFVPAKGKVQIPVMSMYRYGDVFDYVAADTNTDRQGAYSELVRAKRPDLYGFVFFDETHRYRIDLPKPSADKVQEPRHDSQRDPLGLFSANPALKQCLEAANPNDPLGIRTQDTRHARQIEACIERFARKENR